ncbi:MAG: hypothetical protein ABIL58_20075 [Pseudomonadota bacterium]
MKFWMVFNYSLWLFTPEPLPVYRAPRVIYDDKDDATDEMLRLQQAYPDQVFALLESVAQCEQYLIPHQIFHVVEVAA